MKPRSFVFAHLATSLLALAACTGSHLAAAPGSTADGSFLGPGDLATSVEQPLADGGATSPPTGADMSSMGTGFFHVANGQIIDPMGNVFLAHGLGCHPSDMSSMSTNAAGQPLTTLFPGINFIRLGAYYNADSIAAYQTFITQLTSLGIVVEIEDHPYPSPGTYTGDTLQAEVAWYASLGAAFAGNPYVWFGTMNEPHSEAYGTSESEISVQEVAIYNAIRGAGNDSMVLLELDGGGNPGTIGAGFGMTPSSYADMTNVAWDLHFYGWADQYSTDPAAVTAALQGSVSGGFGIAAAQTIQSADGTVPVVIGEFGDSTDGLNVDANAQQVLDAVFASGFGYAAWEWGGEGGPDELTVNGALSGLGQEIAAGIAASAKQSPSAPPSPAQPSCTASANDTVVTTVGPTLCDASGNRWALSSVGAIVMNGATVAHTSNVVELAYVNGAVWQKNSTELWWSYSSGSWVPTTGTSTAPPGI